MGAELVKREDHWALYNEDGHKIAATIPGCKSKLSLKNCEAIANGYDLDEIIEQTKQTLEDSRISSYDSFRIGMETILKILGDKRFSEEDILKAINFGVHVEAGNIDIDYKRYGTKENQFIQSLQKTEWDVEICCYVDNSDGWLDADSFNSPLLTNTGEPKLDADGCLILRRL